MVSVDVKHHVYLLTNQAESSTKFYNSSTPDVVGNVLTLASCIQRFDRAVSFRCPYMHTLSMFNPLTETEAPTTG